MSCACVTANGEGMQPLDKLLRHVVPYVPQLPHNMALDMLRQAYIEFARRSTLLVADADIYLQKGVRDYRLEAPDGYEVFAVKDPEYRDSVLHEHFMYPDANRWYFSTGFKFYIRGNNHLWFCEAPSCDQKKPCTFVVAVLPTECVEDIPTEIATPYGRGIAMKVVAEAVSMPNKPWTNAGISRKYEVEYNRTIMAAKNLGLTNRGARAPMFRPVRIL